MKPFTFSEASLAVAGLVVICAVIAWWLPS